MSNHPNRGTLTINPAGNWHIYTNTLPAGSRAIGTVSRGDVDTGALALIERTGLYVQVNAGAIRTLDQRKVLTALAT